MFYRVNTETTKLCLSVNCFADSLVCVFFMIDLYFLDIYKIRISNVTRWWRLKNDFIIRERKRGVFWGVAERVWLYIGRLWLERARGKTQPVRMGNVNVGEPFIIVVYTRCGLVLTRLSVLLIGTHTRRFYQLFFLTVNILFWPNICICICIISICPSHFRDRRLLNLKCFIFLGGGVVKDKF